MWNRATDTEESFRDKAIWWSAGIVLAGAVAIGVYYRFYSQPAAPEQAPVVAPHAAASASSEPAIQHPLPEGVQNGADATALPALNESDSLVHDSLAGLVGSRPVEQFLVPENIVRHLVVTIDNLPRKKVAVDLRPIKPTAGQTVITSQGDITTLSDANFARYAPFMKLVQSTDVKTLATIYFRLYPLFQQAYEDLGYPGKYFNDRLVEVIDHLLEAPDVQGPIELVQPKVFYQYADESIEDRSAGQKLMIRMGPANEKVIKAKLRDFREEIAKRK
jgi:Protein of unknown function (DUF3014)